MHSGAPKVEYQGCQSSNKYTGDPMKLVLLSCLVLKIAKYHAQFCPSFLMNWGSTFSLFYVRMVHIA